MQCNVVFQVIQVDIENVCHIELHSKGMTVIGAIKYRLYNVFYTISKLD
jgi:hypothetical protein